MKKKMKFNKHFVKKYEKPWESFKKKQKHQYKDIEKYKTPFNNLLDLFQKIKLKKCFHHWEI